jgi:hypothetical protein
VSCALTVNTQCSLRADQKRESHRPGSHVPQTRGRPVSARAPSSRCVCVCVCVGGSARARASACLKMIGRLFSQTDARMQELATRIKAAEGLHNEEESFGT